MQLEDDVSEDELLKDNLSSDDDDEDDFNPDETGDRGESETEISDEDDEDEEEVDENDGEYGSPKQRKVRTRTPNKRKLRGAPAGGTPSKRRATSRQPTTPLGSTRRPKLIATPLPGRVVNDREAPRSDFERARERLHVAALPESLPCREIEFATVYGQVESAIEEGTGCCVYISGVPGTGKTATVHAVMRLLIEAAERDEIAPFQFVEINGMKLTTPAQAYSVLWESLTGNKVSAAHARDLLEKRFNTPSPSRQPVVVLMDELDLLVTKDQSVIYNFFNWPTLPHGRLIVIAVANTMDLPERMLTNKVSSRLGLSRINFTPYTHQQLIEIVQSRLEGINCFDSDAVEYCARKVGAVSGDARRALDICRRGVEILEATMKETSEDAQNLQSNDPAKRMRVTLSVINRAISEMFSSPSVQFVVKASKQQRIFLVALARCIKRSGTVEVEFGQACVIQIAVPLSIIAC
ncbi:P-loop containing nucleoside triphosphate hydrolase protein [Gaertneriomyces semiglobifer]|nr:P-loop containing nucleoside triphosphate hydrolase protein [Gaertneriomyces semiglobifer]